MVLICLNIVAIALPMKPGEKLSITHVGQRIVQERSSHWFLFDGSSMVYGCENAVWNSSCSCSVDEGDDLLFLVGCCDIDEEKTP